MLPKKLEVTRPKKKQKRRSTERGKTAGAREGGRIKVKEA